jgi:hypothetical protein
MYRLSKLSHKVVVWSMESLSQETLKPNIERLMEDMKFDCSIGIRLERV